MSINSAVPNLAGKFDSILPKLSDFTLEFVKRQNFTNMTPVQAACIPLFLKNKDVVVEAVTGSGKTLAYLIPLIEKLLAEPTSQLFGIILVPTRELARQIIGLIDEINESYQLFSMLNNPITKPAELDANEEGEGLNENDVVIEDDISKYDPLFYQKLLLGGSNENLYTQIEQLKSTPTNLIVATPGRLLKILEMKSVKLNRFQLLILDEADKLLDLNFLHAVNDILTLLPKVRRTGLFSATLNENLEQLVRLNLRNPVKVSVKVTDKNFNENRKVPDKLHIQYYITKPYKKLQLILNLLNTTSDLKKCIIYVATCASVDFITSLFNHLIQNISSFDSELAFLDSFEVIPLHGQMDPKRRLHCYEKFKVLTHRFNPKLLVTTDLAARGLDFSNVDLVVNLDLPTDPKSFNHRCGRTARNDAHGTAVYFLNEGSELTYTEFLKVRKVPSTPIQDDLEDAKCLQFMHKLRDMFATKDRDLVEKAVKAYVGFIKFYSKHQASYIFRKEELNFDELAYSYLLLKLPKMPELKTYQSTYEEHPIQLDSVPYLDPKRETARQLQLQNQQEKFQNQVPDIKGKEERKLKKLKNQTAWSEQKLRKEKKLERHTKKINRQKAELANNPNLVQQREEEEETSLVKLLDRKKEAKKVAGKVKGKSSAQTTTSSSQLTQDWDGSGSSSGEDSDFNGKEDWKEFKTAVSSKKLKDKSIKFDIE